MNKILQMFLFHPLKKHKFLYRQHFEGAKQSRTGIRASKLYRGLGTNNNPFD